jgi:hypothetical protein
MRGIGIEEESGTVGNDAMSTDWVVLVRFPKAHVAVRSSRELFAVRSCTVTKLASARKAARRESGSYVAPQPLRFTGDIATNARSEQNIVETAVTRAEVRVSPRR